VKIALPEIAAPLSADALGSALDAMAEEHYANHPFHARMHEGQLTRREVQGWVANRLAYQRALPRKNAAIISNCELPAVRRAWLKRIVYQDGADPGTGGIEMWIRLGEAVGVPRIEMEDERHVLPGVRLACEAYVTFCQARPWIDAVAASLIELHAARVMQQRIAAFPEHYPWVRSEGLEYFRNRVTQAPRDGRQGLSLVQEHCTTVETQRRAFEALAFHLQLLWVMIDTIHHAYAEPL
jgi:pyrroloquinoline-quinone synthase